MCTKADMITVTLFHYKSPFLDADDVAREIGNV